MPPIDLAGAKVLLIGRGYVAQALTPHLIAAGADVSYTQRAASDDPSSVQFGSPTMRAAFETADIVLLSVPPGAEGDPALSALSGAATRADWIGYLSATSVYGDRGGQWAFEGEAPTPGLPRGQRRAEAELAWLERYPMTQVFRLAGIYGPGRSPFERLRQGQARIVDAPGHVVNRIHVEDIVSALLASITHPRPQEIYNIADGHPAPPGDVLNFAADLIGADRPPIMSLSHPDLSNMARSFYAESKRVSVARAQEVLGWNPQYPDYKSGLSATLAAEAKLGK